jgi:4-amino-4-deoxy-L-arabinose transferase-like glycosyltransferase
MDRTQITLLDRLEHHPWMTGIVLFVLNALVYLSCREGMALATAAEVHIVAAGLGFHVLRFLGYPAEGKWFFPAVGVGLAVMALLMFLLGVLGLWQDVIVIPAYFLMLFLAIFQWPPVLKVLLEPLQRQGKEPWVLWDAVLLVFGGFVALFLLVMAFLPPMGFDALEYHLGAPWAWWQRGGIVFLPHLFYSQFPMNMEMLFTLVWRLGGETSIKVFHWSLSLVAAGALYAGIRSRVGRRWALLGALLLYTNIPLMVLSVQAKIDLGLVFFATLAYLSFLRWLDTREQKDVIFLGIFCGIAAGIKYSAIGVLILPVGLGMVCRVIFHQEDLRKKLLHPLVFAGLVVLLFLPWGSRNLINEGNPVFPLGYSVLGGRTLDPEFHAFLARTTDATWPEEMQDLQKTDSVSEFILHFWWVLTRLDVITGLLLISAPLILMQKKNIEAKYLLVMALAGWLVWLTLSRPLPRYLIPVFPAVVLSLVLWGKSIRKPLVENLILIIGILILVYNFSTLGVIARQLKDAPKYLLRQVSREEVLFKGQPHWQAIEFLNRTLGDKEDVKVLFVAEARGYGVEVPYVLNSVYDRAVLLQVIGEGNDPGLWADRLLEAGYSHILYNPIELSRYIETFAQEGWPEGQRLREVMVRLEASPRLKLLWESPPTSKGAVKVWEIYE